MPGNTRARAFYERAGWTDSGPVDREVPGPDGPIAVPVLIYVKPLA